jgi:hypothetical protein
VPEVRKITITPVGRFAEPFVDDEEFSPKDLPFEILPGIFLADVGKQMKHLDLELWSREYLSKHDVDKIQGWRHALVHYYSEEEYSHGTPESQSRELLYRIFLGLRIVRPSRVPFQYLHARVKGDGSLDPSGFYRAEVPLTVCACDTWGPIRASDAELLRAVAPSLIRAFEMRCRPVTRAMSVLETGYNSPNVDVKLLLWVTGLEALFTSSNYSGAPVVIRRVRHFLGSKTQLYRSSDYPGFLSMPTLRVKDLLQDIYRMRNSVAHGEWIPPEFLARSGHAGGAKSYADVLLEAASIVLRLALTRILKDSLLETFGDKDGLDSYFSYDPHAKRVPCSS